MSRKEFMDILARELAGLPTEERLSALKYYEEYFDEAGPENERRAAAELGDPMQAARNIRYDYAARNPSYDPEPGRARPAAPSVEKKRLPVWAVVLIALAAMVFGWPVVAVAVGIAAVLLCLAFVLVLAVAGLAVGCLAAFAGLAVAGVCLIGAGIAGMVLLPGAGMLRIGAGLLAIGIGILLAFAFAWLAFTAVPAVFRWVIELLRRPFHRRKGGAAA